MMPELTQVRTCKRCGKALPINMRTDAMYCPARKGEKRCRTDTKETLIQQLEPWERKSLQERAAIQSRMPKGAAGYRISIVLNDSLYIFPKVGARFHYNAYGHRVKGSYIQLKELARVPKSALYKIEYVDADGSVIETGACFMSLSRTPRGRISATANPTSRRVSAAIWAGAPIEDSTRVSQLASHLGISTVEILPVIARCGINVRPHARSSVSRAECAVIAAEIQRWRGVVKSENVETPSGAEDGRQSPAQGGIAHTPHPMVVMTTPGVLEEEFRTIGRRLAGVEKDLATLTVASNTIVAAAVNGATSVEREGDKLSGISFANGPTTTTTSDERVPVREDEQSRRLKP